MVLEAEAGLFSVADVRARAVGVAAGEEDAGGEDGAGLEIPAADAVAVMVESGGQEEEDGEETGVNDDPVGAGDH